MERLKGALSKYIEYRYRSEFSSRLSEYVYSGVAKRLRFLSRNRGLDHLLIPFL
jgi:hypothetical protein